MRPLRGLLCAALVVSSLAGHAQGFASRPVKLIVPATAGGPSDVLARTLAPLLAVELGQPVVVENVPGGGGSVAQSRLALAKADGHTLFLGNVGQVAANPNFVGRLPYDTARDFRAIASVADAPQVLTVRADLPVRDFDQFADYVKAHAREMNWATAGIGSGAHLGGLRVNAAIGVEVNAVHYPGSAQAVTEVMAGRLDYMVESITTAVASVASGKVRAIAVLGGERSGAMPGVSAIAEARLGSGIRHQIWNLLIVPAATPDAVVAQLNAAVGKTLAHPATVEHYGRLGLSVPDAAERTPQGATALMRSELVRWRQVLEAAGVRPAGEI